MLLSNGPLDKKQLVEKDRREACLGDGSWALNSDQQFANHGRKAEEYLIIALWDYDV